jgi:cytochrome c oxidase subunit 2
MDFTDPKNMGRRDPGQELYLPVGKKVRVRIIAKDVLHNFYLPHFRVKMDAVPGMPTYFVFTPVKTTAEYRVNCANIRSSMNLTTLQTQPGRNAGKNSNTNWLAQNLCGKGHYSMKRILRKIVSQEEFDAW